LEDITPQLSEKQISELEAVIYMARETGEPQLAYNNQKLRLIVFPSGLMTKKEDDMDRYAYKRRVAEARLQEAGKRGGGMNPANRG